MTSNELIRFDYAIKKLLRNKANFGVLEGRTIATSSLEQININKSGILVVIINGKSYKVSL